MKRYLSAVALLLMLVLAACGANDADDTTVVDDTGIQEDTTVVDDTAVSDDSTVQDDTTAETDPGYPAPSGDDNADDTTQDGATEAYPAPASSADMDVASRLAEFNIELPQGAQQVAVDDQGEDDLEATFEVPGMSGDEVIGFFQESLTATGYEIEELETGEIEFRNDVRTGEIDLEENSDPTRFKIEVEPR